MRRDDTAETLHGRDIADPYRWLEDADSAETINFVREQNAVTEPYLDALPALPAFSSLTNELVRVPGRGCPMQRADKLFAWHSDARNQPVLIVADSVDELETGREVLDANRLSADGTVAVTSASPSPDGAYVAWGAADGGADWRTVRVRDVATGIDLDDILEWTKWNPPVWMPDGQSFTYWCYDAPSGDALTEEQGAGRLMLHRLGQPQSNDTVLFARPDEPRLFARHWPRDDDWFVLSTDTGASSGNDLAARRHDSREWLQLVSGHEHEWHAVGRNGSLLYVVTDSGAPRYRLAAFDLESGTESTVVAEHDTDVLTGASLTATGLVLEYAHDASHRAQLFAFDGTPGDSLPIGDGVSITGSDATTNSNTVYLSTVSFSNSGTRHVFEVAGARLLHAREVPTPGGTSIAARTTRIRAKSSDGTEVPAFLVQPDDFEASGPRPTLLWGYGGFNIAETPSFRIVLAAWLSAGGTVVVANLRGGGEFGSAWHEAGTLGNKQQVFDDLYAIAEHLIETGVTTKAQLAVHGRSNGGLLAGAALTQRPELWAAALPSVGVLDMLRFHKFTIGWAWISDYGDPENAEDFEALYAYSPLHNIQTREYPATLITTGDHDDRVVPAHSFKFAAELQRAQQLAGGTAPVLISIDTRAGHGMGKPKDAAAREYALQLAFAAHHTGLIR